MASQEHRHGTPRHGRERVYAQLRRVAATLAVPAVLLVATVPAAGAAPSPQADPVVDARDAYRRHDRARLATLKAQLTAARHPLASWVDYWELTSRLMEVSSPEVEAFYARWPGSYVEDRLRNDWLLELGHRRDWRAFSADFPRFRMNDDRSVTCYALLTEHMAGHDVTAAARTAWLAQKDDDEGCALLAATLVDAHLFSARDVWRRVRLATDANRPRAARQAAALLDPALDGTVQDIFDNPTRYLARKAQTTSATAAELTTLALIRLAATDPSVAAAAMRDRWERALPAGLASWAWSAIGKQAAMKLLPDAPDDFMRAGLLAADPSAAAVATTVTVPTSPPEGAEDALAWQARAALRANDGAGRWQQVMQAINAMPPTEQQDATWVYWKARALQAIAGDSQDGAELRSQARTLLASISGQFSFYGRLAAESLGPPPVLPPKAQPPTADERAATAASPGLTRAVLLIGIGLRAEGVREWNYTLRGMGDRELLAAAQFACDREVWDRCINSSDRTKDEFDMAQRYPTPYRAQVVARSKAIGLDPAFVYGLIRQESRFMTDLRSAAGAGGLMQIMPSTAAWTAKKTGVRYVPGELMDRDTNILLGTQYLKMVLDGFGGSQALAAAAYNAGPGRPRRWSAGPVLDVAAWTENIPFNETRDYVKKVLTNAAYYGALLAGGAPSLASRLGRPIGPQDTTAPASYKDLP